MFLALNNEPQQIKKLALNISRNEDYKSFCSIFKVETHNHPTAIAPFAGAATGAGGEIRDEGATRAHVSFPDAGQVDYA